MESAQSHFARCQMSGDLDVALTDSLTVTHRGEPFSSRSAQLAGGRAAEVYIYMCSLTSRHIYHCAPNIVVTESPEP